MSNLDNRIQNADQLLTQDVEKFCEGLVELYSNLTKVCPRPLFSALSSVILKPITHFLQPVVDVLLYVSRLGGALGWGAPAILFAYLLGSGVFLTYLRRPVSPSFIYLF